MESSALLREVGERLTRFRTTAGLTVDTAAARTDVGPDRLAQAEEGASALTGDEIERLATAYGIDPTEIFGGRVTPLQNYAGG